MLLPRISAAKRFSALGLLLFGSLLCFTRATEASPMVIEIDATPASGGATIPYTLDYSDGNYTTQANGNSTWWGEEDVSPQLHVKWHLDVDLDPGISGPITITNNFGVPTTFTASLTLPIFSPIAPGAPMLGSSTISVNDGNFNASATLSAPAGSALYHATIDSVDQQLLFAAPYSLSVSTPGATAGDTASFIGTTTLPLTSQLGITNSFVLTPGDIATVNSSFFVGTNVPEPAAFVLGCLAVGSLAFRRKERC